MSLPCSDRLQCITDLLLARTGDDCVELRTRKRTWMWDEVVRESRGRRQAV